MNQSTRANDAPEHEPGRGNVYLVGAGPGDAELLTAKGLRCLRRADVVVYDSQVSAKLLEHTRTDAELVGASRGAGDDRQTRERIAQLMVDRALAGKMVVRLSAGDAWLFGCAAEEAAALAAAGVNYDIVPGIAPAVAAAAYAGIPLSQGRHAASVTIVNAAESDDGDGLQLDWQHLAKGAGTLVIMNGAHNLKAIAEKLLAVGRGAETPIAVIQGGATPRQQTHYATLASIADTASGQLIDASAVIVVGEAARIHDQLRWYERKPLFGTRIVVTRPRGKASSFAELLEHHGADVLVRPAIEPQPLDDYQLLDDAIRRLDGYDWLLFTSVHGVQFFEQRLWRSGRDLRAVGKAKLCAIGPKTAAALEALRLRVDLVPDEYRAEAVLEALGEDVRGLRFLLPRAEAAREMLPDLLRQRGASIDVVPAYRTVMPQPSEDDLAAELERQRISAVTFTSSSTVTNFLAMLPHGRAADLLDGVVLASIGPITSDTLRANGLEPTVTAREYTIEGLTKELLEYFGNRIPPPAKVEQRSGNHQESDHALPPLPASPSTPE